MGWWGCGVVMVEFMVEFAAVVVARVPWLAAATAATTVFVSVAAAAGAGGGVLGWVARAGSRHPASPPPLVRNLMTDPPGCMKFDTS